MKVGLVVMAFLGCVGCGYSSVGNELIGQAKKMAHNTPIICPDYDMADISLGVMRNGIGSMSTQDVWMTVPRQRDRETLDAAVQAGAIVKVTYDVKRITFCYEDHFVTGVEILK